MKFNISKVQKVADVFYESKALPSTVDVRVLLTSLFLLTNNIS